MMKRVLFGTIVLLLVLPLAGATKQLVNIDEDGIGLQGYDPVAFFTENQPVKGSQEFTSIFKGVTYHFASAKNRDTFNKTPAKYEPQFGGFCAYGVSRGKKVPIKIEAFQIVNGRLLMQYDLDVRDKFNKDTNGNLKSADEKWPSVLEEYGN
jgi:YHS domain-containing protein